MSWAKDAAEVGLSGLTHLEAARGAMFLPCFQDMPDPLRGGVDITSPEDIPLVSVSTYIDFFTFHVVGVDTARYVYSTVDLI